METDTGMEREGETETETVGETEEGETERETTTMKCINCIQLAFQLSLQFNWQLAIANWKFKANIRCSSCCCCCYFCCCCFLLGVGCVCFCVYPSWRPMLPNAAEVIDTNVSMCLHMLSVCLCLCLCRTFSFSLSLRHSPSFSLCVY